MQKCWPDNAPFVLCLSHDVDHVKRYMYQRLWRIAHSDLRFGIREINDFISSIWRSSSAWNFEKIMELEESFNARSTFLFMNETAKGFGAKYWGRYDVSADSIKSIIKYIDSAGWEIGLHGSLNSYNNFSLLKREKEDLEDIVGHKITSTRQHYLRWDSEITPKNYEDLNISVDSTMGFSSKPYSLEYGAYPYYLKGTGVLELPITIMDTLNFADKNVRESCESIVQEIASLGGVITLDWHQCMFDEYLFPDRVSFYKDLLCFAKEKRAWITTMNQVDLFWKELMPHEGSTV